jgi:phosphoribosylaminoimidazole carboxylase (NCAIR synthetase)
MQWYGKAISKSGRKMGHLNVVSPYQESTTTVIEELKTKAMAARATFFEGWTQPINPNQGENR